MHELIDQETTQKKALSSGQQIIWDCSQMFSWLAKFDKAKD